MIAHYKGGAWAVSPSPTMETLFGVWSRDAGHAWLVGSNAAAFHWDGAHWN